MTGRRRRTAGEARGLRVPPLLLAAAGVLSFGLIGAGLLFLGGPDDDAESARDTATEPPANRATGAETDASADQEPTATASAEPVSGAALERFARRYVRTASDNPKRGLALLTDDYRGASPRYLEVWSNISDPRVLTVVPDPDTLSVTYTYSYAYSGAPRTEEVTLRLVRRSSGLLIAGATARPR